jgi:hypothetical protein
MGDTNTNKTHEVSVLETDARTGTLRKRVVEVPGPGFGTGLSEERMKELFSGMREVTAIDADGKETLGAQLSAEKSDEIAISFKKQIDRDEAKRNNNNSA